MIRSGTFLLTWLFVATAWADQPVFTTHRPPDNRPRHDPMQLRKEGILRYESQRLILWSDLDPADVRSLPALIDQAYDAWVKYFGPPLPDRDGAEYQLTGYLMRDRERFLELGLLPREFSQFQHGMNRGYEFWLETQESPYYRRHLLIHEATHCFMQIVPGRRAPLWYLEGMAEYFGVHAEDQPGKFRFGVMPDALATFRGFGRIEMIRKAVAAERPLSLTQVLALGDKEFARSRSEPYAWGWALCHFLDAHPRYHKRFRGLGQYLANDEFVTHLQEDFAKDYSELSAEWDQFQRTIGYGYDIPRSTIDFRVGVPLAAVQKATSKVESGRGWQSSGVQVLADQTYSVAATGRVTLSQGSGSWDSEPAGISIRYAAGQPIGRLLLSVLSDESNTWEKPLPYEPELAFRPTTTGTVYFRVNDYWSELADNTGEYQVTIRMR